MNTTRKYPKRLPTSCSVRLTPKPPSRNFGTPKVLVFFVGGPFAGEVAKVRTLPMLPLAARGGIYRQSGGTSMVWGAA